MSAEELAAGMRWVSERFFPILKESDAPAAKDEQPSIEWVLDKARVAVLRWGRGWGAAVRRAQLAGGAGVGLPEAGATVWPVPGAVALERPQRLLALLAAARPARSAAARAGTASAAWSSTRTTS
jgi:hypothetical protein